MPKRIINGEALWRSDKLAKVNPPKFRAEYANILPLALANGVFEVNPSRVWSEVYSYNRTDVSRGEVAKILQAFEDVGLLFRWTDDTGKAWGYWTGSEKPGRLPSRSMRKHYEVGPTPPQDQLSAYLQRNGHSRPEQPVDPTPEKRKPTKTTLPDGFGISEAVREWAKQNGYTRLRNISNASLATQRLMARRMPIGIKLSRTAFATTGQSSTTQHLRWLAKDCWSALEPR